MVVFPFVPLTWITGMSGSGTVGTGPGSAAATSRATSAITRSGERRSTDRHRARDGAGEGLRRPSPAPREHDDHLSELGTGASAHAEPSGAGGGGDPSRQLHRDARGRSDALLTPACTGIDRADPGRVERSR